MTIHIHIRIAGTIAALVIVAVAAPGAAMAAGGAHVVPDSSINYREPGSTGYLPVATTAAASGSGFDWASALIGAGAATGIAVACAGGLTAVRKRRGLAHV